MFKTETNKGTRGAAVAPITEIAPADLQLQLNEQRRTVDFDTFDIHMQQLVAMTKAGQIKVSPAYQRKFRWSAERCSQFIESLLLGIPVPSLFMATNADNTWEAVDGLQRLSTIIMFAGDSEVREKLSLGNPLRLDGLQKLTGFNKRSFTDLPMVLQQFFWTRPIKVITLNDKSDIVVRYDLFERLNTGGVVLSPQEIRDCVLRGSFADKLEEWAADSNFKTVVKLTSLQQRDATAEECVLRFFAFRARYKTFQHDVKKFLTDYMEASTQKFDFTAGEAVFAKTFRELARLFPDGIRRPGGKSTTPLNLFEGIAVGASLALDKVNRLSVEGLANWMKSEELRSHTTGATNSKPAVVGRIEFCRDRFLGKPYVPRASA